MKKRIIVIILLCFYIVSCGEKEKIFKEETIIVEKPLQADTITGNLLNIDGVYTGGVGAYDSLIFFYSSQYPDYVIYVFSAKTGKQISSIMKVGEGPNEYIARMIGCMEQVQVDNNVCMWFVDIKKNKCVLIDWINGAVRKEIYVSGLRSGFEYPWSAPLSKHIILNDSLLMAHNQGEEIYKDNAGNTEDFFSTPTYHIFNYRTKQKIKSYEPYNKFKYNENIPPQISLYSWDRIKPDRTKLAMGMLFLGQINIMDIETGKITGYYIKDTPNFDVLRKHSDFNRRYFYSLIFVDNDFIYGTLNESEYRLINEEYRLINENGKTTLYVFDWNGNFKKVLILDKAMESIALDPVNKQIYVLTNGAEDEEVYRYDVGYLYEK